MCQTAATLACQLGLPTHRHRRYCCCCLCYCCWLLLQVIEKEGITCSDDGLEAIVFTADGDMRQALNNLQVLLLLLRLAGGASDDVHAGMLSSASACSCRK